MSKFTSGNYRVDDPHRLLMLTVLDEAFRTIECYYAKEGTVEERLEGKDAIKWILKMSGNFKLVAIASGKSLEEFHQLCIWKINCIRERVVNKKHEQKSVGEKNK